MVAARRWVLHLDMDAFFASVEQLTRPTLAGRPVLVGGTGGRGVVAGASYQARAFGARSAMPMHQATRLVGPSAVVVPPRGLVYSAVSRRIFRAVRSMVPVIEQLSFDEAFAEPAVLAGADESTVRDFAESLRYVVRREVGLAASVGAGGGKQIAKIASGQAKPDGVAVISPDEQESFLDGLPVRKLWGIGPVAGEKLARIGVETIGDLAALSTVEVTSVLGATVGPALHRLAQGHDDRKVTERSSAKQISAEHTYAEDLTTLAALRAGIVKAGQSAHRRLLADGRGARTVVVKMKKSDMSVLTRSATLTPATTDPNVLLAAARRLALDPLEIGPIRLVGVGFSGLTAVQQYSMFPELDVVDADATDASASDVDDTASAPSIPRARWSTGVDVSHETLGHGWVQGAGHGVVTVRFETRATGPGIARTFADDDPALQRADPLASLDWSATDFDDL